MNKVRAALLLALIAAPSCGEEPIGVNNVSPGGSVGGLIVDAATLKPLAAGVNVTVIAGARQFPDVAADAGGRFAVDGVPSGDILIQIKAPPSHHSVTIEAVLPNAAGDFPLANAILSLGPIGLLPVAPAESAFRVQLITPDGAPAANVKAHLRTSVGWVDLGSGNPVGQGSAFVEAASDGTGAVRFTGMPDIVKVAGMVGVTATTISDVVRVIVPPFDRDKDGVLDFFGKEQAFQLLKVGSAVPTIILSSTPPGGLQVVASNIAAMMGRGGNRVLASPTGPLLCTFNWPLVDKLTEVLVFDERGGPLPAAPKKTVSANQLTVTFEGLQEASEYNVNIRAVATVEGNSIEGSFGAPVFTPIKPGKVQVLGLKRDKSRVLVTFSEPIGIAPGQHMSGAYAALFFNHDLNASGTIGDAPGERGAASTALPMTNDEVAPGGVAGLSGLSRYWSFDIPSDGINLLPSGTSFDFGFSKVKAGAVQRADGSLVGDIPNQSIP